MIKIEAAQRLLAYDNRWSQKVNKDIAEKYRGQQKPQILVDDAVFSLQPAALAGRLKALYKDDYQGAMGALNLYKNRAGKTLPMGDKQRLDKAKTALRKLYKREDPNKPKPVKPQDFTPVGMKPNNSNPVGK